MQEIEIASLLLVNRLFTPCRRMQIYSMKDLLLSQQQINNFDRAMDMKEIMDAEKAKAQANPHLPELTVEEIEGARKKNQEEMEARYQSSNQPLQRPPRGPNAVLGVNYDLKS